MIAGAQALLAVIAFVAFILLVTALGLFFGVIAFWLLAWLLCLAAIMTGVGIALAIVIAIDAAVRRFCTRLTDFDVMAQPHGDVAKIPVR